MRGRTSFSGPVHICTIPSYDSEDCIIGYLSGRPYTKMTVDIRWSLFKSAQKTDPDCLYSILSNNSAGSANGILSFSSAPLQQKKDQNRVETHTIHINELRELSMQECGILDIYTQHFYPYPKEIRVCGGKKTHSSSFHLAFYTSTSFRSYEASSSARSSLSSSSPVKWYISIGRVEWRTFRSMWSDNLNRSNVFYPSAHISKCMW